MIRSPSSRARTRRYSPLELAIGFALVGSLVAVAAPAFVREVHASHFVEPVDGLHRIGASAIAYARDRPIAQAFPPSAPLTPSAPPRGHCEVEAPAQWQDQPTWKALDFQPAPAGAPQCFAFSFDSALSPTKATFRARAHGDLDGDGIPSTFEVTGHAIAGDPAGPAVDPGMAVDSEVE